jgi:hypothetical protein
MTDELNTFIFSLLQVRRLGDAEQALHTEALRLEKGSSFLPGIGPILKLVGDCRKEGLGQHHTPYAACDLLYFCALSLGDYPLAAEAAAVQVRAAWNAGAFGILQA